MASTKHHRQVRPKRTTKNLNYGHFGTATFEESTHRWRFLREIHTLDKDEAGESDLATFRLVHEHFQQLEKPSVQPCNSVAQRPTTAGTRHVLLKHAPENLAAAQSVPLPSRNEVSQDLRQTEKRGQIIAFGNARALGDHGFRSRLVPIVALPVGTGGEIIRLHGIDATRFVPDDEVDRRGTWHVPCISTSRMGLWRQSTDPILQVSFCTSHDQTSLLIRQSRGTSVLRPIIKSGITSAVRPSGLGSTEKPTGTSIIDPNHLLTIPSTRTGGHRHADAVFSPKNPNILAIIDVSGQWSVWKIKGKEPLSARIVVKAKLLHRGNMFSTALHEFASDQNVGPDGWYRLCWLSNPTSKNDSLLVCSRALAHVADGQGTSTNWVDMRLGPPSDGIIILDLKQSVRDMRLVYALSASRLQIFCTSQVDIGSGSGKEPLDLVCSWSHFRDEQDVDLSMSVVEHPQNTCVFLHSLSSTVVTVFQFCHSESGSGVESSWGPVTMQWPERLSQTVAAIASLAIVPVDFRVNNRAFNQFDWGVVKMVAWTSHGEIIEAFYRHKLGNAFEMKEVNSIIPLLRLPEATKKRYFSSRLVEEDDLDDFVVEDDFENEYAEQRNSELVETMQEATHVFSSATEIRLWETILDYATLQSDEDFRPAISDSFNRASQQYDDSWNESFPLLTLANLLKEPRVLDLEAASQNMDHWINWISAADNIYVQPTKSHSTSPFAASGATSLLTFYDAFLAAYITPLSPHVRNRNRVNREKIVRQTATDAFLSGIGLLSRQEILESDDGPQAPAQSLSSQPFMLTTSTVSAKLAVSRLRTYAVFRSEADPLPEKTSVTLSKILDHLPTTIDSNPTNYSYETATKQIQDAQDEEAELSLDPRERAKLKREAAKRLRSLGKQTQFSQDIQVQRSMPPSVTNRHFRAPTVPGREFQSSQPAVPASSQSQGYSDRMFNMSQPERGVHGTRPVKKKAPKPTPGF